MSVGKIFKVLIIVVACVAIGALVLNTLLPNVTTQLINSVEDMIYKATKMEFDFNNDGKAGGKSGTVSYEDNTNMNMDVEGFVD